MKYSNVYKLAYVLLIIELLVEIRNCGQYQKKLLSKLFKNYKRLERPVEDDSESIVVNLGLAVQQIVNIDEKMQNIVFSGWLDMNWKDYNLVWDPKDYGNITTIRLPSEKIWMPDLLLYNSADDSFDSTAQVNAVVQFTGDVSYIPPGMFRSTCQFSVKDFPFDNQICSLKFGSWTHDEAYINLTSKSDRGQNDSYIKNAEWFLVDIISFRESISYDCCPEKYPFVMFEIHIRRRALYYEFNLIFPCILISCLTMLGFCLPPDSGEKIGLEVTVLLTIITFSQLVSESIPHSSLSVSKIALYFMSVMVISSLSIFANIIVLIFHFRNVKINKPMSKWVEVFVCEFLARMLRMKTPIRLKADHRRESLKTAIKTKSISLSNINDVYFFGDGLDTVSSNESINLAPAKNKETIKLNNLKMNNPTSYKKYNDYKRYINNLKRENKDRDSSIFAEECESNGGSRSVYENTSMASEMLSTIKTDFSTLDTCLNSILKEVRVITRQFKEEEEYEEKELKYKFAAIVIDRLCMVIFAFMIFTSTAIIFTSENFMMDSDPDPKY